MKIPRILIRRSSSTSSFVTSPIFYANAEPHIGHAYTAVLCDAAYRWNRLKNPDAPAIFSIGTDEHGSKIFRAAEKAGMAPKAFCDRVSGKFRDLFEKFELSHTHFIRTTDLEHKRAVQSFWQKLEEKDCLYKSKYAGFYCVTDECFVPDSEVEDRVIDGKSVKVQKNTVNGVVEWIEEENYMFRLSRFREDVRRWIESADVVRPSKYKSLALDSLEMDEDLSVSRTRARLSWGVPVPGDEQHTIYVWLDALVNYLTVSGYPNGQSVWPPTCQIIGKDITKFHVYYWPAFLLAAGFDLPRRVFVHGHWLVDNVKMSKSLGNVVNPAEAAEKFTAEGLRYFLLKQGNPSYDCSFSAQSCLETINSDLVNNVGNLLNRSSVLKLNPDGIYPEVHELHPEVKENAEKLVEMLDSLAEKCEEQYEELMYYKVIELCMSCMKEANRVFQQAAPWKETDGARLRSVLFVAYESVRVVSTLLQPITPKMAAFCLDRLGVPSSGRNLKMAKIGKFSGGNNLGADEGVFIGRLQK